MRKIVILAFIFTACKKESNVTSNGEAKDCNCDRIVSTPYFNLTTPDGVKHYNYKITTVNDCSGEEKTEQVKTNGPLYYKSGDCRK